MTAQQPVILTDDDVIKIGSFKGLRRDWKALPREQKDLHFEEHENRGKPTVVMIPKLGNCNRCGGTGRISYYNHVAGGICFKCGGRG